MMERRSCDRLLLFASIMLVGFGAVMVYSSTAVVTPVMERKHITELYYLKKHMFTMLLGFIAMYVAYKVDREILRKLAIPILFISFVMLLLVFVPGLGVEAGGAKRWLRLWPSTVQPSEVVKLAMVLFLAWFMSRENYDPKRMWYFAVPVGVMGIFQLVIINQPDFGAVMSLGVLTMCLLFISGIRTAYLAGTLVISAPVLYILLHESYRYKRLITFLDPWKYRNEGGFQLIQSFIAFGNGGVGGVGLGKSMQKLDFLPEVHTDFIFSMVGEELGLVRALIVLALFAFIFYRGIIIAGMQRDKFGYYLVYGLSLMIALQALVNIFVVTGLLPTKGLPLPFISYGGSALLVNMTIIGLLLNFSKPLAHRFDDPGDRLATLIKMKKAKRAIYGSTR